MNAEQGKTWWWTREFSEAPGDHIRYVVLACPDCGRRLVSFGCFSESRVNFNTALRSPCCEVEPSVVVEDMDRQGHSTVVHAECAS